MPVHPKAMLIRRGGEQRALTPILTPPPRQPLAPLSNPPHHGSIHLPYQRWRCHPCTRFHTNRPRGAIPKQPSGARWLPSSPALTRRCVSGRGDRACPLCEARPEPAEREGSWGEGARIHAADQRTHQQVRRVWKGHFRGWRRRRGSASSGPMIGPLSRDDGGVFHPVTVRCTLYCTLYGKICCEVDASNLLTPRTDRVPRTECHVKVSFRFW